MQDYSSEIFTIIKYMVTQEYGSTYSNLNFVLDGDDNSNPLKFPCLRMLVTKDSSTADNFENTEQACDMDVVWECYMTGDTRQNVCKTILAYVTDQMRAKGFIVRMKPIKAASTDANICRYTTRFNRVISNSL